MPRTTPKGKKPASKGKAKSVSAKAKAEPKATPAKAKAKPKPKETPAKPKPKPKARSAKAKPSTVTIRPALTDRRSSARAAAGPEIAAVDLGSNSFHLVVAKEEHGHLHVLDRDRVQVMLASGLRADGRLSAAVEGRALGCLARFGERLKDMPRDRVRVVGTNTLRAIGDGGTFLVRAEEAIGQPIEVVSGVEEARLVYLGVSHHAPSIVGWRLVVDIGGGSTECILGEGFEAIDCASLDMGCVRGSLQYFKGGKITDKRFDRAIIGAQLELRTIKRRFRARGWASCLGSSGTIRSVAAMVRARWGDGAITLPRLLELRDACVRAGSVKRLDLAGMPDDRAAVLPGGLAILIGLFRSLRITRMTAASGALREGVLYDMLGRIHHEDVRVRTIRVFCDRYHVDEEQATRVERTARFCFERVAAAWKLAEVDGARLSWAARLHEIGRSVSYNGHHRHGAYLVEHADMPGFSMEDQRLIALLIRAHRRKIPSGLLSAIPPARRAIARRLLALLRISALINRSRSQSAPPLSDVVARKDTLHLEFPAGWLDRHVMTGADLKEERAALRAIRVGLMYE